jgi:TRAP-type C4-dicarboxylate transport system permease small subunit
MKRRKTHGDLYKGFLNTVKWGSSFLNTIAGISLVFLMCLTIGDVIMRYFRRPIPGTYELVAFSGAVVIGFSLPFTSWVRQHIFVDSFIAYFSQKTRNGLHVFTRVICIGLFFIIGWNLFKYGDSLYKSGEVSLTIQMPFYPIAYGVGVCCFIECLVLITDIIKIAGGEYE